MKTVDVVFMKQGWYVTRRWGGMNQGNKFFPFTIQKKGKPVDNTKQANIDKDTYIKEWMGE
jgi:hypothetical protein